MNEQKMPKGRQRQRKSLRFCQIIVIPFAIIASVAKASNAPRPSALQSFQFPANYASPPADGAAEWHFSEQEMAQLAIQELLQLQREQQRNGDSERNAERQQKNTKIFPYSLYKRLEEWKRVKKNKEKEHLLKTNTPVVIHLPAYRSTTKANGGEPSAKQSIKSSFDRAEITQKVNPIRAQSNRWHRPSDGEEKVGNSELNTKRLIKANQMTNRLKVSSAEHSLITRPQAMFIPSRNGLRPTQLRPIEPINDSKTDRIQQKEQQLFIKRITSADAYEEEGKRLSPPANSAFVSGTVLAPSSASALSLPAQFVSPLSAHSPASLVGSPFDLLGGQSVPNSAAVQPNALLSQLPNPLQILSQGSTLEQITTLARNLIQMSNGKNDLLSSLSKAIGSPASSADSAASKLTSTAVQSIAKSASKVAAQGEKMAAIGTIGGGGETVKTLFSSNGTMETEEEQKEQQMNITSSPVDLLNALPAEQRILLEAAMKNGELDLAQTAKAFSGEMSGLKANEDEMGKEKAKLVNAESRLMEWIQQNRPRPGTEQQQKDGKTAPNAEKSASAEKLPYYGKYCGHFVERANLSRLYNVAGAVWAIDERRLLISKFNFQPFGHSADENLTFWAGPAKVTGTSQDFLPSENGFFISPAKLDTNTFANWPIKKVPAHLRAQILPINGRENYGINGTTEKGKTAEEEEEEETGANRIGKRAKRNLYSELYEQMAAEGTTTANRTKAEEAAKKDSLAASLAPSSSSDGVGVVPIHFDGMAQNFHLHLGTTAKRNEQQQASNKFPKNKEDTDGLAIDLPAEAIRTGEECHWTSLGWHGGTQPVLITLPNNRLIKTLNWLSIWDHTQKQVIALVLLPSSASGASFQPPSSVQLRPLPSPNASVGKRLQSGPIRVLDTKTIELTEFSLSTEGVPLWFMVGKEIVPNRNGQIVPVFNKNSRTFDCDSLRDFHNETVTLRLSDPLDMKDVFWFSVYSIPRSQSLAHIYIPYNDMQLPPDLLALPTPQCVWSHPSSAAVG